MDITEQIDKSMQELRDKILEGYTRAMSEGIEQGIQRKLRTMGWMPPPAAGQEVINFTTVKDGYNDTLIFVYRWTDEDGWMWDEHKDTLEETIQRYPFDKYVWVSFYD